MRGLWCVHPNRDDECEVDQKVKSKNQVLPQMQPPGAERICEKGDGNCSNGKERCVPLSKRVALVIKGYQNLNDRAANEDSPGIPRLPRQS